MREDLYILWSSGDEWSAHYLVMQYATNAITQDWWDSVTVIIWGGSARLLAENENVQLRMKMASGVGVKFSACAVTARQLGVEKVLSDLGVEIKGWGRDLSKLIKDRAYMLTV